MKRFACATAAAFGPLLLRPGVMHVQLKINAVENVCNNLTNPYCTGTWRTPLF